jgi:hypothetical protein
VPPTVPVSLKSLDAIRVYLFPDRDVVVLEPLKRVTALTGEGPFRSNVDCDSVQPSLFTLLIGYFHELALP